MSYVGCQLVDKIIIYKNCDALRMLGIFISSWRYVKTGFDKSVKILEPCIFFSSLIRVWMS